MNFENTGFFLNRRASGTKFLPGFLTALVVVLGFSPTTRAQAQNTPEYRSELAHQKNYPEALKAYREALEKDLMNPALLFNVGLMAYLAGKPEESLDPWLKLKEIEPQNWRVRTKLIQAYEALGQPGKRDAEIAALLKLRKTTTDKVLKETKFFIRDQFSVGETRVMVFDYFDLEGDEPIRWSFDLLPTEGKHIKDRYILTLYKATNARALEIKEIKKDERLFHLDGYKDDRRIHEMYGDFVGEPVYETIKATVQEIIQGKRSPHLAKP